MLVSSLRSNADLLKKIVEARPLLVAATRQLSQKVEDILCLYGDESYNFRERYRVLDEKDYNRFLSKRSLKREPALTRAITSLAYKIGKEMISLAEGMPNEQIFPFDRLELRTKSGGKLILDEKEMAVALQYLPSQGLPQLLSVLRELQQHAHRPPGDVHRDVLVCNGGQHGIYQCVEMLMDHGDPVICPQYTFTGFHSAIRPYDPELLAIPEDDDGIIPETLESVLRERLARGLKMPRMMYTIPTGNNPTGSVLTNERRRQIYELACKYDFLILEDDPYAYLNYSDERAASFLSLDECGRVLRVDSLSKVLCAGVRGAWLTAPAPLLARAEMHTQAELLHSCSLSQMILYRVLSERSAFAAHIHSARSFYQQRCAALGAALPALQDLATWREPRAGLFYWLHIHGIDDAYNMAFHTALERGIMVCPGQAFQFDARARSDRLRLTFARVRLEDVGAAVERLADAIRAERKAPRRRATEA